MADFLNAADEIEKHGAMLPHWQQGKVMQFGTFRLGDSIQISKLADWREQRTIWLKLHPNPWSPEIEKEYHQRFTKQMESWLDEGGGSCLFNNSENRRIMAEVLLRFQGDRVEHHIWVIMPNHVHLLFTPKDSLESLIKAWKGATARRINLGSIWQKNYRDTLIRDGRHYENAVRYIRRNPEKLRAGTYTLWESSRAREVP